MNATIRRGLWPLVIAALALALVGQLVAQRAGGAPARDDVDHAYDGQIDMVYRFRPKTFREGRDKAPLIVLADIAAVERGPDHVTRLPNEPNGEARVPTQRVTLTILKVYRGQATTGQRLTLAQTGGTTDDYPYPRFAEDNPRYQQGERYVLMLEEAGQPDLLRIIAPEGRYRLDSSGAVIPMVDNAVTQGLRGRHLPDLEALLAAP